MSNPVGDSAKIKQIIIILSTQDYTVISSAFIAALLVHLIGGLGRKGGGECSGVLVTRV